MTSNVCPSPCTTSANRLTHKKQENLLFFMLKSVCGGAADTQHVWNIENVHTMLLTAESDMCSWISANTGGCSWVASGISPCGSVAALTPKVWNGAGQTEFCKGSAALWWHVEAAESTTVTQTRKQQRCLHDDRWLVCFFLVSDLLEELHHFLQVRCGVCFLGTSMRHRLRSSSQGSSKFLEGGNKFWIMFLATKNT